MVINMLFRRIRDLREDNDYTQLEIADILNCDMSLYSKYERGEREVPRKNRRSVILAVRHGE